VVHPLSTNNSLPLVSSSKAPVGTPLTSKAAPLARLHQPWQALLQGLLRHLTRVVRVVVEVVQALQPSQQQVQQLHRRLHRLPLALLLALVTETF